MFGRFLVKYWVHWIQFDIFSVNIVYIFLINWLKVLRHDKLVFKLLAFHLVVFACVNILIFLQEHSPADRG